MAHFLFLLQVSGSEERPDSPSDSLDGTKKGERKKEFVCQVGRRRGFARVRAASRRVADLLLSLLQACEKAGEDLVPCEGQCCGMFHLQCLGMMELEDKLLCQECSTGETADTPGSSC